MDAERVQMWIGWLLMLISLSLGFLLLDTLSSGGKNPPLLVALHVHGIGFGMVLLLLGRELSKIHKYPLLRSMAALSSSSGAVLFAGSIVLKLAGETAFSGAIEVLGAALFTAGIVTIVAILAE